MSSTAVTSISLRGCQYPKANRPMYCTRCGAAMRILRARNYILQGRRYSLDSGRYHLILLFRYRCPHKRWYNFDHTDTEVEVADLYINRPQGRLGVETEQGDFIVD